MNSAIPHIITPLSAPWCGWMMLGLLLCAVLGEWFQPGVISQAVSSLGVRNDRTYKEAPVNFQGQLLVSIFRVGTVAMALCLCMAPEGNFSFKAFWAVCGLTVLVLVVKMLCNQLLDYTFMLKRRFGTPYEHYGNLFTLVAVVLYPMLLVLIRLTMHELTQWSVAGVALLFCLIWLYRCIRTYIISFNAFIYLIIYLVTLEILPFAGLAYMCAKTIAVL